MQRQRMGPTTTAVTTLIPLTLLLLFTSLLLPTFTLAWSPNAYCCAAFATFNEKIFYVEGGGASQGTGLPQFFSLDLTISGWKTSDPPYVPLSGGNGSAVAPSAAYHSMAVSPDGQRLTLWAQQKRTIFTYDVPSTLWLTERPLPEVTSIYRKEILQSATDPSTGLIYFPSGSANGTSMFVYNPIANTPTYLTMPSQSVINGTVSGYSFQWCAHRKSMLLYGGGDADPDRDNIPANYSNPYLIEYSPLTNNWTRLTTSGPSPGPVIYHCMASAYGGKKMVVFGGELYLEHPRGSIFILDVPTLTWTQGPDIDNPLSRSSAACTVAGDNFVVWGGKNETSMLDSTVIFNIKDNVWTDTFVLPGNNTGAIIGGVATALVVLGLVGAVIHRRRNIKEREKEYRVIQLPSEPDEHNPQAITLESLKYSQEPRHPEYITPQVQNDLFYLQNNATRENNNPQLDLQLLYETIPTSEQPRGPQFRMGAPQENAYVRHGRPQNYNVHQRMVVVSPQAQAQARIIQLQQQQQQLLQLPQYQPLSLAAKQQLYLDELDRLRIEYQRLENPDNANTRHM
ncbi:Multiple epidermal growth factor-like domains protein 8 [Mortierella sp. GBA39]|nr:Multiple epidermal growth factor-like domains protein 8 [Mortierella sp. GBA39]